MSRILAQSDTEIFLMSLGAAFVEENQILDELLQRIDVDALNDSEQREEEVRSALKEVGQFFFSLNMGFEEDIASDALSILDVHWGIDGKEKALASLKDIREQGHRTKFNVLRLLLPKDGSIDSQQLEKFKQVFIFDFMDPSSVALGDEDFLKLAQWVQGTNKYLGDSGILGWDLARYVHLLRLCYMSGLFDDEQSWQALNELAPLVQNKWEGWMEFSQSFLIGRTFWSGAADPQLKESCERLMGYPISPWILVKWPARAV